MLFANFSILTTKQLEDKYNDVIEKWVDINFSEQNLIMAMYDLEIQHKEIVFRQAYVESGNFKSKLFKKGNNMFGMKRASQRVTTALKKTIGGYATYQHWIHSIIDYKLWQGETKIKDYKTFLKKRNYAQNPNYISHLKSVRINKDIKELLNIINEKPLVAEKEKK